MVDKFTLCRRVKDSPWASGVSGIYALAGRHVFEKIEVAANVAGAYTEQGSTLAATACASDEDDRIT